MPSLQNTVLTDRKATPVAHTFTPLDKSGNVGTVSENTGVPAGSARLSVSKRVTSGPQGRSVVELKLAVPVLVTETINGVARQKVERTAYADVSFKFDATSTEAERNDVVGMLQSAFAPAQKLVNDSVVKLESIY
jgi:hypothetical protein